MNTSAKVIQVIEIIETRGEGTKKDPVRRVYCYTDLKGNFLAEHDNWKRSKRHKGDCLIMEDNDGGNS